MGGLDDLSLKVFDGDVRDIENDISDLRVAILHF